MKLPLIILASSCTLALPLNTHEKKYLIKCQIGGLIQRNFIADQVNNFELDVWEERVQNREASEVTLLVNTVQMHKINEMLTCQSPIDVEDLEKKTQSKSLVPVEKNFFADYRSYREIVRKLTGYRSSGDLNITMESMGKSHESRDIHVVRVKSASSMPSKKIWISCGQHAREWIAPAACLYLLDQTIRNSSDKRIAKMLKQYELLVAPLINPDGYEYSRNVYRYWRKNRRVSGWGRYGVDLNRNWPGKWGIIGTSDNPSSDIYRGPSAGSEPEIAATVKYISSLRGLVAGIDVHSYGELIMRNYGWTTEACPDEETYKLIGDKVAERMASIYGTQYISQRSGELYPAMGSMDDWVYLEAKAMGMTFELRDKGDYGFLLPAKYIGPVGEELLEGIVTLSESL